MLPIGDIFRRLGLHFYLDFSLGFGPLQPSAELEIQRGRRAGHDI